MACFDVEQAYRSIKYGNATMEGEIAVLEVLSA
jgi:hypothetical protein